MPRGEDEVKKKQKQKLQLQSTEGAVKKIASADRKATLHFVLEMLSENPA